MENLKKRMRPLVRFFVAALYYFCLVILSPFLVLLCLIPLFPTRNLRANVQNRLTLNKIQSLVFAFRVYANYMKYFFESLFILPLGCVECANFNEIAQKFKEYSLALPQNFPNRGFVLLSAHFGHIESAGLLVSKALASNNLEPMFVLAQPSKNKMVQHVVEAYRKMAQLNVILTQRSQMVRTLLKSCKEGKNLGLLVDQKPRKDGIFISFFGKPAAFPSTGLSLCVREGLSPVYVVAERIAMGKFHIHLEKGRIPPSDKDALWVEQEMTHFANWLEKRIRAAPHQWFWDYRKWSRNPT
jgi:lauroyl/myristoyl acyltransferase